MFVLVCSAASSESLANSRDRSLSSSLCQGSRRTFGSSPWSSPRPVSFHLSIRSRFVSTSEECTFEPRRSSIPPPLDHNDRIFLGIPAPPHAGSNRTARFNSVSSDEYRTGPFPFFFRVSLISRFDSILLYGASTFWF